MEAILVSLLHAQIILNENESGRFQNEFNQQTADSLTKLHWLNDLKLLNVS